MADEAAKRRALRRKRILENAEERKRKIFGTTLGVDVKEAVVCEDPPLPNLTRDTPPLPNLIQDVPPLQQLPSTQDTPSSHHPIHSTPNAMFQNNHINVENTTPIPTTLSHPSTPDSGMLNGSLTDSAEHLLRFGQLSGSVNGNAAAPRDIEGIVAKNVEVRQPVVVPVVVAIVVCCFLSLQLGYIVSHSVALPFLVWEGHNLWCRWQALQAAAQSNTGLLTFILMLSGVNPATISTYMLLITILRCFMEDLCVYMFTVVVWYSVMGLPYSHPHDGGTESAKAASVGEGNDQGMFEDF